MEIQTYTLISGNVGFVERLMQAPLTDKKFGYRITGDMDESGSYGVDQTAAVLVAPDGREVARLQITPVAIGEVRQAIQRDLEASKATAAGDPAPTKVAPAEVVEAGRVQRQVGQALQADDRVGPDRILLIPIDQISHFPGGNVREVFTGLEELAADIKRRGIQSPLTVNARGGKYTLVAGERRLRAAGLAGLPEVPCRVVYMDDTEALEWMLTENIQRADLNPLEEARAYKRLLAIHGDQGKVAEAVGKERVHVNEALALLEIPGGPLADKIAAKRIAARVGLEAVRKTRDLPNHLRQRVFDRIADREPSARDAAKVIDEALAAEGVGRSTPSKQTTPVTPKADPPATRPEPPKALTDQAPASPPAPAATPAPQTAPSPEPAPKPAEPTPGPTPKEPVHLPGQMALPGFVIKTSDEIRATVLAGIGRERWRPTGEVRFNRECYLPLERLIRHFEQRQQVAPKQIPEWFGPAYLEIPEQRVWIRQQFGGNTAALKVDDGRLILNAGSGGVEGVYSGNPVYYRVELHTAAPFVKLEQQVVIQDGGRHLIMGGSFVVQIQKADVIAKWEDMMRELPGLPES